MGQYFQEINILRKWQKEPSTEMRTSQGVKHTSTTTDQMPSEGTASECIYDALEWNKEYKEGSIVCYDGLAYRIMQDTVSSEYYKPTDEGMLAIYMRYRGEDLYEWLYGEYVEQGWQRSYEGVVYECITATAVANIYPPNIAVSVWKIAN